MIRRYLLAAAVVAAVASCSRSHAARPTPIMPEPTANRHGLTRPWFAQVQMDRGRARVQHIILYEGMLYVQTDRATVHAIDAETGATRWAGKVGRSNHPSFAPAANADLLAIINGSRLYVCNRHNGNLVYEAEVGGAPIAGAALSEQYAYVPMVDGLVTAYRLESLTAPPKELSEIEKDLAKEEENNAEENGEEQPREKVRLRQEFIAPLSCQSIGRALVQPLVTRQTEGEEYCVWPTDRGHMNVAHVNRASGDRLAVMWRLETGTDIAARPTYLPPDTEEPSDSGIIFAASRDGFVHAVLENRGTLLWRFSTSEPILQPAVVIGQRVYVATQPGGMYCLNASDGQEIWWAPRVIQLVAASKERIYAADRLGRILVLHGKTGSRLDTIPTVGQSIKLLNDATDRIYLATRTGLIQCLHEVELTEPILHRASRAAAEEKTPPPAVGQKGPEDKPTERTKPPPVQKRPPDGAGNGGDAEAQEDPFGGAGPAE